MERIKCFVKEESCLKRNRTASEDKRNEKECDNEEKMPETVGNKGNKEMLLKWKE